MRDVDSLQLVRRAAPSRPPLRLDAAGRRVVEHRAGFLRVLGGPGTGKTRLLVEAVVARVASGVDPEHVLVLLGSRRAATELRERITERLARLGPPSGGLPRTVREPVVRTVHSYAFAVLRLAAAVRGQAAPRLLSGPEQDVVVRELLAGERAGDGADSGWPQRVRPALEVPGFAAELRDLLLRAAERGLGPADLLALGRRQGVAEWVAAGRFFRGYEQVTLLRGAAGTGAPQATGPALDAAELVAAAGDAFAADPELLATERVRVRHLLVDDAQDLDPQQRALIDRLGTAAESFLLAGDPDQSVLGFRGADPALLRDADPGQAHTVVLTVDHRAAPVLREATARVAARLPGAGPQRVRTGTDGPSGVLDVRVFGSAAQEAAWVADRLRRAHLSDGVPWSQMAVVVRSTARALPPLRRALLAAGVPLAVPGDELPLARASAVLPLLLLLRCAVRPAALDADAAVALLTSPLGGADPLRLRRLRRGLLRLEAAAGGARSSDELLVAILRGPEDSLAALPGRDSAPLRRVTGLLAAARASVAAGAGVEDVLWQLWQRSGLERRWTALSAAGGALGAQADRDLDAVVALFDAAARYVDRLPGAGVAGFADYLADQQIPGDSLAARAPTGEAVAVLTAHTARGREWTVVAVPGVQEGSWPDLRRRGTLLGVERLVDTLGEVPDAALGGGPDAALGGGPGAAPGGGPGGVLSASAPLLAAERRLFLVATSRARAALHVSAVRGEEEQPSRFLDELADECDEVWPLTRPGRALVLAELVGELRRAVCDEATEPGRRRRAGAQLGRLATAGVAGAHPDSWYGLPALSTDAPLRGPVEPVSVSPSTVELIGTCPLRWVLERHGGQDQTSLPSVTGLLVHALVQAVAEGASDAEVADELARRWASVDAGAPWFSRLELARVQAMLATFRTWHQRSRDELTEVAVERELDLECDGVRVRGRVDRLEVDGRGRPVIVDIKTGKNAVTVADAQAHPQLAVYQLAAALGAFAGLPPEPGGARLVYVSRTVARTGSATERVQDAPDAETLARWRTSVTDAAAASASPGFTGQENDGCTRCPVRGACPLTESGRQVTQ